jgi:indole-3-glycerol phosphate synthase
VSDFITALRSARRPLIMEIKRRDAHGRELMAERSIASVVKSYAEAGAPCLSVVTGQWFGGTPQMLGEVARLSGLPLLQKDFLTRRQQLVQAREHGASAVLLTAALLPRASMVTLVQAALDLGLTPFIEVTREEELAGLPSPGDCVIAVNNKDIRTKETDAGDLDRSARLLPAVLATGTRCPVSASGIADPGIAAGLLAQGYAGLLVGTSLLLSADVDQWLSALDSHRTVTRSYRSG